MKKISMLERFAAQSLVEHDGELIFSKEKFAELIIKECIKLSQPPGEYPVDDTWIAKSYWEGCYDSSERIKEHFGVEE